jgi:hypothetical protein
MGTGQRTPVVERKRERRRGEEKQTATLENAVIITAMARSPRQLMVKRRVVQFGVCHETEDVGGVGGGGTRAGGAATCATLQFPSIQTMLLNKMPVHQCGARPAAAGETA